MALQVISDLSTVFKLISGILVDSVVYLFILSFFTMTNLLGDGRIRGNVTIYSQVAIPLSEAH